MAQYMPFGRLQLQTMGFIIFDRPWMKIHLVTGMIMENWTGELFCTKNWDGLLCAVWIWTSSGIMEPGFEDLSQAKHCSNPKVISFLDDNEKGTIKDNNSESTSRNMGALQHVLLHLFVLQMFQRCVTNCSVQLLQYSWCSVIFALQLLQCDVQWQVQLCPQSSVKW